MEQNAVLEAVKKYNKGTIRQIVYAKPMKTRKGVNDSVMKITSTQARFGINYDNIKKVKEARANGTLPTENQGLPTNTKWIDYPYLIENTNTHNVQLRCAKAHGNKTVTTYLKNGKIVSKEEIEPLCLASEFPKNRNDIEIYNICIDKIISIK